jgi:hypothetical protein
MLADGRYLQFARIETEDLTPHTWTIHLWVNTFHTTQAYHRDNGDSRASLIGWQVIRSSSNFIATEEEGPGLQHIDT